MTEVKSKRKLSVKAKKAFDIMVENGGVVSTAMIEAGYSPATAKTPQKLTESKGWQELMAEYLPDVDVAKRHQELMNSTTIDHMVFPLGPKGEDDINFNGGRTESNKIEDGGVPVERTTLTDQEIKDMLAEVNCKVRRIVHGETARHVYFWTADSKARKDAIDMAYKLKGSYAPVKSLVANIHVNEERRQQSKSIITNILRRRTS